jgi:hypothetical protein
VKGSLLRSPFYSTDEKTTPAQSEVKSSSPYFSWTTKLNPKLSYEISHSNSSSSEEASDNIRALLWQQLFTKNDYEEYSPTASFHLGSLHLLNLKEGQRGTVRLLAQNNGTEQGTDGIDKHNLIHDWQFEILSKT